MLKNTFFDSSTLGVCVYVCMLQNAREQLSSCEFYMEKPMRSEKPMHGIGHELFDNHLFTRPKAPYK